MEKLNTEKKIILNFWNLIYKLFYIFFKEKSDNLEQWERGCGTEIGKTTANNKGKLSWKI